VSYRTFKHLLGETSLERKCRFIFGLGILLLVTVSFFLYGKKTEELVMTQTTKSARLIVDDARNKYHTKLLTTKDNESVINAIWGESNSPDDQPQYQARVLSVYNLTDRDKQPADEWERTQLARFVQAAQKNDPARKAAKSGDRSLPMWEQRTINGKTINGKPEKQFQYIQEVLFDKPSCLMACHAGEGTNFDNHLSRPTADGKDWVFPKLGDLAGAMVITLPMDQTTKAINANRAMLITAALITAIVAMFSSYTIVRYVIVKPVKHLRDVSDAIAAGRLNIRSKIETGDEFEELSHAFNRMLHNLVAMQQELREVNGDLDRKVDELAQANMALFEMNRLKSDFLATMSHELRTPLNSIIGFSEVLSGTEQLGDRHRRYASNIQSSGRMLLSMINDILDLAKIESGKMEVRSEDFSIRDVCEGLTNLCRPVAERKNVTMECRLDEAIPLLRQDPGKLKQILYNLLSNAIKFTPEGGRVTLRARADARFVVVEVEDTGIGIAEEDRETIFEKFRQAKLPGQGETVLTREHQGTGLGLSIVRELTKLLGGDVHLESQPGQGSTFTVRVPMMLPGNRKFEVTLSDERIDLTKARRIEAHPPFPHLTLGRSPGPILPESEPYDSSRGRTRNPSVT
jgi:two-component system, NarL family, sensor histidine kinase BarA